MVVSRDSRPCQSARPRGRMARCADPRRSSCSPASVASISHCMMPASTSSGRTNGSRRPRPNTRPRASYRISRPASSDAHEVVPYDIERVLDEAIVDGIRYLPKVDLVVGGFPCQDYSVAKPLSQASGIAGKKGVLWWQIHRLLEFATTAVLLPRERRPAAQVAVDEPRTRLRDHAVVGRRDLGYSVEWRVVNAADYGFPQKRRRVFIVGRHGSIRRDPLSILTRSGVLARALPIEPLTMSVDHEPDFTLDADLCRAHADLRRPKVDAVPERRLHEGPQGLDTRSQGLVPRRARDAWQHPPARGSRCRASSSSRRRRSRRGGT